MDASHIEQKMTSKSTFAIDYGYKRFDKLDTTLVIMKLWKLVESLFHETKKKMKYPFNC